MSARRVSCSECGLTVAACIASFGRETRGGFGKHRSGHGLADQMAADAQLTLAGGCGHDADKGLLARAAIHKQQLVASHKFEPGARARGDSEVALREAAAQIGVGRGRNDDVIAVALPQGGSRCAAIIVVQ